MRHSYKSRFVWSRWFRMALVPLLAYGQQPATAPQQPQVQSQVQPATSTTTFTASAHLVLEEVSVKDKNGKTALDLAIANVQNDVASVLMRTP